MLQMYAVKHQWRDHSHQWEKTLAKTGRMTATTVNIATAAVGCSELSMHHSPSAMRMAPSGPLIFDISFDWPALCCSAVVDHGWFSPTTFGLVGWVRCVPHFPFRFRTAMQTFESQLLYHFAALRCGGQGLHLWGCRDFCCRPRNNNYHLEPIKK